MKTVVRSPQKYSRTNLEGHDYRVFLAGTIDNGSVNPWAERIVSGMDVGDIDVQFLDPRRTDWDTSMECTRDNPEFHEQVDWELNGIKSANIVVFNFLPGSMSPVTMMELGYACATKHFRCVYVCCPQGFWCKGNVDIICERSLIKVFETEEELITAVANRIKFLKGNVVTIGRTRFGESGMIDG